MSQLTVIGSTAAILDALSCNRQHDAHVLARQRTLWLQQRQAFSAAAGQRVAREVESLNAKWREQHCGQPSDPEHLPSL
jgi:hypothetical protein